MNLITIFGAFLATHLLREKQQRIAERRRRAVASGWLDCIAIEPPQPRLGDLLAELSRRPT